jgi:hypothetical protein
MYPVAQVSKLFGVRVGGERVSSQKLVSAVIRNQVEDVPVFARLNNLANAPGTDHDEVVDGDQPFVDLFDESDPIDREMLSNALLLSLAFQGLVIEEASECFRALRSS